MTIPSVAYGSAACSLPKSDERFLRIAMAKSFGPLAGRSTAARLLAGEADPARYLIEKAIMAWVCGLWDSLVDLSIMKEAWKAASIERMSCTGPGRARQGGAASLFGALERIGWVSPAVDALNSRDGALLCFGERGAAGGGCEADPSLIKEFLRDDYEQAMLVTSQVSKDFGDIRGLGGYARSAVGSECRVGSVEEGGLGDAMGEEASRAAKLWRRGRFKHHEDRPVPWMWPVAATIRAARKAGWERGASSLRSLVGGGWPL